MEISKEFVSYEEALELKELGFDEPCFGVYYSKDRDVRKTDINEKGNAPLYQQVFRFFREKHGLTILIDRGLNGYYGLLNKKNGSIYKNEWIHEEGNFVKSYEEAELACLRKLIEISK